MTHIAEEFNSQPDEPVEPTLYSDVPHSGKFAPAPETPFIKFNSDLDMNKVNPVPNSPEEFAEGIDGGVDKPRESRTGSKARKFLLATTLTLGAVSGASALVNKNTGATPASSTSEKTDQTATTIDPALVRIRAEVAEANAIEEKTRTATPEFAYVNQETSTPTFNDVKILFQDIELALITGKIEFIEAVLGVPLNKDSSLFASVSKKVEDIKDDPVTYTLDSFHYGPVNDSDSSIKQDPSNPNAFYVEVNEKRQDQVNTDPLMQHVVLKSIYNPVADGEVWVISDVTNITSR